MGDTTNLLGENDIVGSANEVAVVSGLPQPEFDVGSNVATNVISSELADFFLEFEKKTPNFYLFFNLEWHLWN
jgi:hypothetical protein